ncbi:MAG: YidC/Oxa1 family membrane protein insertase [Armatimonadota bacterium]|nr:YidC/Oxa1 family membrane protein insertase [Armatimonadota bacterium]MCX7777040.1 YidC/Oxa1 family membrane protein insertase [Armatimonadota bacterium]MDW8024892.1 YidC/Oxa1 family membrane protein insertase [Armatimonadota bacterium]
MIWRDQRAKVEVNMSLLRIVPPLRSLTVLSKAVIGYLLACVLIAVTVKAVRCEFEHTALGKPYSPESALDVSLVRSRSEAEKELKRLHKFVRDKRCTLPEAWAQLRRGAIYELVLKEFAKAEAAYEALVREYEDASRSKEQAVKMEALSCSNHVATACFRAAEIKRVFYRRSIGTDREGRMRKQAIKAYQHLEWLSSYRGMLANAYVVHHDGAVKMELAYEAALRRLDEFYREYFSYKLLDALVSMTGRDKRYSYGLAIIMLTLLVRILLFPLNRKAYKSMRMLQRLQPEIQKLQKKYRKDPQRLNRELLELYRRHKVSPFSGCLPLLIQFPILIAVYWAVVYYKYQFLHASFLWIRSLAHPDFILFGLYFISLIVSQRLMTKLSPPTDPQQQQTQQLLSWLFPLMVLLFFWSFPAAFILYWLAFNIAMTVEQYFIQRGLKRSDETGGYPIKRLEQAQRPTDDALSTNVMHREEIAAYKRMQAEARRTKQPKIRRIFREARIRRYFR